MQIGSFEAKAPDTNYFAPSTVRLALIAGSGDPTTRSIKRMPYFVNGQVKFFEISLPEYGVGQDDRKVPSRPSRIGFGERWDAKRLLDKGLGWPAGLARRLTPLKG